MNNTQYYKDLVYDVLKVGKDNAINQSDIQLITGLNKRHIRQIIHDLRQDGYPVLSTSYDGYWIAINVEEVDYCMNHILSQITTLSSTYKALQEIRLEEYGCL